MAAWLEGRGCEKVQHDPDFFLLPRPLNSHIAVLQALVTSFQQLRQEDANEASQPCDQEALTASNKLVESCVNTPDSSGLTPLSTACMYGNVEATRWLLTAVSGFQEILCIRAVLSRCCEHTDTAGSTHVLDTDIQIASYVCTAAWIQNIPTTQISALSRQLP